MRYLLITLFLVLAVVLQTTFFHTFSIQGIGPNLVLILVVFFSLLQGSRAGSFFGLLAGLFLDLISGRYIGLNTLTLAAVGGLIGLIEGRLYKDNLLVPMGAVLVATIILNLLAYLLALFAGLQITFKTLWMTLLIQALYNTALVPLFYGKFYHSTTQGWLRKEEVGS
ncbi:rod shape-determining protein MreD [Heliorestis acidaminivorans]|uniref:Rod shape-determining protein MreD n=1 Tax=Heliorestis acidaminivorans TaxID=553427 RepID=A0A6I0ETE6_9FIRM|nr:rod shape-determining protein MreD [Heliorestis acidaminivorans]KAB2952338.1 rod shape-determining protein MreD [Heliorestis acidaminivorans]